MGFKYLLFVGVIGVFLFSGFSLGFEFEKAVEFTNGSLPLPSSSTENYDDEHIVKSRTKRFITFNVLAPIDLGLLLAIPITLILPTLSNFFNKRIKKSIPDDLNPEIYQDHPIVQTHLDRVSNYFDLLQIPEASCQQRAVCEFSATPEKYYPISELVLDRIRNPTLPSMSYSDDDEEQDSAISSIYNKSKKPKKSLFKVYNKAADQGMNSGHEACHQEFGKKCPYSIEKRLNMPVLRFWKALSTLLKFTIKDTV